MAPGRGESRAISLHAQVPNVPVQVEVRREANRSAFNTSGWSGGKFRSGCKKGGLKRLVLICERLADMRVQIKRTQTHTHIHMT